MTREELYLIAKLTRTNTTSKAFMSAEDVLLNGLTRTQVIHKYGISKSSVSDSIKRLVTAHSEICSVFKINN